MFLRFVYLHCVFTFGLFFHESRERSCQVVESHTLNQEDLHLDQDTFSPHNNNDNNNDNQLHFLRVNTFSTY